MFSRREVMRIGALSVLSAPVASALESDRNAAASRKRPERKAIFILLQGGPSHIDLWDPKPEAPAEVRGPFKTIATRLPGLILGETLTQTARIAGNITLIRSMEHRFSNHIAGTYITLTGSTNQADVDREAHPEDFPGPGAILSYLDRRHGGVPASVSLPTWLSIPGPSNRMPGQYGGVLGSVYNPFLISGEPQKPEYAPVNLTLPAEVTLDRFRGRSHLRDQLDDATRRLDVASVAVQDAHREAALRMLTDPRLRQALDLSRESDRIRDRYGRTKIGQSLLLARRLIEAGVRFVGYNEFNQAWDHHGDIGNTLKHHVPPMEQAFTALVEDLDARGLLDETLVVNTGEFGRTPQINQTNGRDHWPFAYTTVLAGGGVRAGQVYGQSDSRGAYVKSHPVSPVDLLATMWHCLGIDPATEFHDRKSRPWLVSTGRVVEEIL